MFSIIPLLVQDNNFSAYYIFCTLFIKPKFNLSMIFRRIWRFYRIIVSKLKQSQFFNRYEYFLRYVSKIRRNKYICLNQNRKTTSKKFLLFLSVTQIDDIIRNLESFFYFICKCTFWCYFCILSVFLKGILFSIFTFNVYYKNMGRRM